MFSNTFLIIIIFNFYRHDELKIGTLVGTDEMGNRYYENNTYFYGNYLSIDDNIFSFVGMLFNSVDIFQDVIVG